MEVKRLNLTTGQERKAEARALKEFKSLVCWNGPKEKKMKKTTKTTTKKVTKKKVSPKVCPHCGNTRVYEQDFDFNKKGDKVHALMNCDGCGRDFIAVYDVNFIGIELEECKKVFLPK